jgi:DeoR family fructose operon transcriptional repressor
MATMFSQSRRLRILKLIRQCKKLPVHELCSLLQVSPATGRGDLRDLDREGLLVRTHGDALEKSRAGFEQVPCRRSRLRFEEQGVGVLVAKAT